MAPDRSTTAADARLISPKVHVFKVIMRTRVGCLGAANAIEQWDKSIFFELLCQGLQQVLRPLGNDILEMLVLQTRRMTKRTTLPEKPRLQLLAIPPALPLASMALQPLPPEKLHSLQVALESRSLLSACIQGGKWK
jgi:hypothetical protein